jgi:hypothetical protein
MLGGYKPSSSAKSKAAAIVSLEENSPNRPHMTGFHVPSLNRCMGRT